MGKLIVLEGTDGSGKSTQFELLTKRLAQEGQTFHRLRFPRYDNPSATLIKMYLGGEFGKNPGDVNAYAASLFYAVDRYASYMQDWKEAYQNGGLFLADRYTTSNAVHQGGKLPVEEQESFFRWLYELEYEKIGLPKPDLVLCLDMPIELTEQLMRKREENTNTHADIHEQDQSYLRHCRDALLHAAETGSWQVVSCARDGKLRTVEDIHEELYAKVKQVIGND